MNDVGRVDVNERLHVLSGQDSIRCGSSVVVLDHAVIDLVARIFSGADGFVIAAVANTVSRDNLQLRESVAGFDFNPKNIPIAVKRNAGKL